MRIKIIFILISCFFIAPSHLLAQEHYNYQQDYISQREIALQKALEAAERGSAIEEALRKVTIELTLEYGFAAYGKQIFELMDSQGQLASKLTYPSRGEMYIVKGEVGFGEQFFIGGRYGSSNFKNKTSTDEDWNLYDPTWPYGTDAYVDYQISKQGGKSKTEFFDINLYCRVLSLDKEKLEPTHFLRQKENTFFEDLIVDKFALDLFGGYQYQNNRRTMIDPVTEILRNDEGDWYYAVGLPANEGLESPYEIEYQGPRFGFRAVGSKGKLTTKICFAYALLETKAEAFWNLRDLYFWQKGKRGTGIDIELETSYAFNPHLSLGLGFNFLYRHQKKMKMYAVEGGMPWWEGYQDRIRNADSVMYLPSVLLKFVW